MAQKKGGTPGPGHGPRVVDDPNEPVPIMQKILDNPFLLLFIGVTVPTVFYTIWGIMEVATIPLGK
ncbi:conserved hypothetical protein [uncultured Gammaproteobacteria bacterium]